VKTVAVAWTGASGLAYGLRLVDCLLAAGCRVWLLYSQAAQIVAKQEADLVLPAQPREAQRLLAERFNDSAGRLRVSDRNDWNAPPASGSNPPDACRVTASSAVAPSRSAFARSNALLNSSWTQARHASFHCLEAELALLPAGRSVGTGFAAKAQGLLAHDEVDVLGEALDQSPVEASRRRISAIQAGA